MAKNPEVKVSYTVVNQAFNQGIRDMNKSVNTLNKEFALQREQMKNSSSESEKLEATVSNLNQEYELAQQKTKMVASALENTKEITGANSEATRIWTDKLLDAQRKEEALKNRIQETNVKLKEATTAERALTEEQKKSIEASEKRKAKLSELETSQGKLVSSSEKLTKEYDLQVASLGNNARESEKTKLKQQLLADQLKNTASQTQNLEQQLELARQEYGNTSTEVDRLENELLDVRLASQQFTNELAASTNRLANFGDKMTNIGNGMKTVGKNMSMYVTAPIVAGVGLSVKAASDFDTAFTGVKKTVDELVDSNGKTAISYADLEKGIREMAQTIPATTTEISAVAEAAGQLGISTDNVLSFTKTMIDLGESTNMSSEEAATSLARLANITQMPQTEFNNLGSSIVELGNNFATTEGEITAMSLRLAGAGSIVGMSEADITGLAAALSSVGIEAEAGGSAISKVMVEMQLATSKGKDAFKGLQQVAEHNGIAWDNVTAAVSKGGKELKNMSNAMGLGNKGLSDIYKAASDAEGSLVDFAEIAGMSGDEFAKAFKDDAVGAIGKFVEGLGQAEERGTSAIEMLDNMGISEVRLRDALLRAGGASELFSKAISTSNKAWKENTALTDEANKRYETFESKLAVVKNKINDIAIEVGGPLMDAFASMLDALDPVFKAIGKVAKAFSNTNPAVQKVIMIIVAVVAAIGPLIFILGTLLTSIGSIATFLAGPLAASIVAAAAPFVPLVAAIAAVIAIFTLAYNKIEPFRKLINWLVDTVVTGIQLIFTVLTSADLSKLDVVASKMDKLIPPGWVDKIIDATGKVRQAFNRMSSTVEATIDVITGKISSTDQIKEKFGEDFLESEAQMIVKFGTKIKTTIDEVVETFRNMWKMLSDSIDKFMKENAVPIQKAIDKIIAKFKPLMDFIKTIIDVVKNNLIPTLAVIFAPIALQAYFIYNILRAVFKNIEKAFEGFLDFVAGVVEVFLGLFVFDFDTVLKGLKDMIDGLAKMKDATIKALQDVIVDPFKDLWNLIGPTVTKLGKDIYKGVSDWFTGIVDGVKEWGTGVYKALAEFFTSIKDSIVNGFNSFVQSVKDGWHAMTDPIVEGTKQLIKDIADTWDSIIQSTIDAWTSFSEFMKPIIDGFVNVIMVPISFIQTMLEAIWLLIVAGVTIAWEAIKIGTQIAWDQIKKYIINPITDAYDFVVTKLSEFGQWIETKWNQIVELTVLGWNTIKDSIITPIVAGYDAVVLKIGELAIWLVAKWNEIVASAKAVWEMLRDTVIGVVVGIWMYVTTKFTELRDFLMGKWVEIQLGAIQLWQSIKQSIIDPVVEMKDRVVALVVELWNGLMERFEAIRAGAVSKFNAARDAIVGPIESAKEKVDKIVKDIKGFFDNMKLKIPEPSMPKLPHFSLRTTSKKVLGKDITFPSGIDVEWYAKGGILTKPTMFGMNGNSAMVGGEAGKEAVIPLTSNNLAGIGKGIESQMFNGTLENMLNTFINNMSMRQQPIELVMVNQLDSKIIGESSAVYVDDTFVQTGNNTGSGIGGRRR